MSGLGKRTGGNPDTAPQADSTRAGGFALTALDKLPARPMTALSEAARRVIGTDTVPRYDPVLTAGGPVRRARTAAEPAAVFVPACIGTIFGADPGPGVTQAFLDLCDRAGVEVRVPEGIEALCCGTPWKSKGMTDGNTRNRDAVLPVLAAATAVPGSRLPVVVDAASCTEGFRALVAEADETRSISVVDAVQFTDEVLLPRLPPVRRMASLALHPTCSSVRLGANPALLRVAAAAAEEVVVPDDWGCCAFAGDRGLLHPELTASATAREATEVTTRKFEAYASVNRTCELGLTRATGRPYRHVLEVLTDAYGQ